MTPSRLAFLMSELDRLQVPDSTREADDRRDLLYGRCHSEIVAAEPLRGMLVDRVKCNAYCRLYRRTS